MNCQELVSTFGEMDGEWAVLLQTRIKFPLPGTEGRDDGGTEQHISMRAGGEKGRWTLVSQVI